jgi:hypothetical protein
MSPAPPADSCAIVAMVRTATGTYDPDEVADRLIPRFLDGLCPRDKPQTPA